MKVGIFVDTEELENGLNIDDLDKLISRGYTQIILETTPRTYKYVRDLLTKAAQRHGLGGIYLAFTMSWKKKLYPLDTIKELIDLFEITTIFVRVYESKDNDLDFKVAAKAIADVAPERTYLFGAVMDPTSPETNVYKLHTELTQLLGIKKEGFSPMVYALDQYTSGDWYPAVFVKDLTQEEFDTMIFQLEQYYKEIFLFPYSYAHTMDIPEGITIHDNSVKENEIIKDEMICIVENRIRSSPGVTGTVFGRVQVGATIEILERKAVGQYDEYARIAKGAWVVLRYKGKNYYDPLD